MKERVRNAWCVVLSAVVAALSLCANAANTFEVSTVRFWPLVTIGSGKVGPSSDALPNYTTMYLLTMDDYKSWDKSLDDLKAKAFVTATDYTWANSGSGPETEAKWENGASTGGTVTVRDTTAGGKKAVLPDPYGNKGKGIQSDDPDDDPYELVLASETDWYAIHADNDGDESNFSCEPWIIHMAHGEFAAPTPPEPPQFALVSAKQRWPWNGKVDITYTAANLKAAGVYKVEVEVKVKKGEDEGEGWMVKSILVDIPSENGTKKLVADLDGVFPAETLDPDAQLKLRLIQVK